ncbi:MAG: hypothetical protein IJH34_03065 [Romboutsia sp.]|jgi:hypothetical protein|nr:hypothetical protein [Romboutsia sp.]
MAENNGIQRLFGGCGCNDFEDIIPFIIIIGAVLLFGDELVDFIDCNEEITLIFIVILLILLFI